VLDLLEKSKSPGLLQGLFDPFYYSSIFNMSMNSLLGL
jgi:hypothetical protein